MSAKFQGRYESEGSDYEEYSNDDNTEYITESEHEFNPETDNGEETTNSTEENVDDETSVSEPEETESEAKAKETDAENEVDKDLAKKFEEWRKNHKPQELPTELFENPENNHERAEPIKDEADNTKTEPKSDGDSNTNQQQSEGDDSKNEKQSEENNTTSSTQYPKELLEYLKNKKGDVSKDRRESDNSDDSDTGKEKDNTEKPDTKNSKIDTDNGPLLKRHLYTEVLMPSRNKYWISVPQAEKYNWSCKDKTKLITLRPEGRFGYREYKLIEREMEKTRRRHVNSKFSGYEIVKIEKVVNPCLWRRYRTRRKEILLENEGVCNEKMLFHGSPAWRYIIVNGLDERHANVNGMFGAGLYFAENSSKSNQYVFGLSNGNRCPTHKDKNCTVCERVLLLFRVCLGKMKQVTEAQNLSFEPVGYNSVMAVPKPGGLMFTEYVIYRGEQAYPEYVITYKLKP